MGNRVVRLFRRAQQLAIAPRFIELDWNRESRKSAWKIVFEFAIERWNRWLSVRVLQWRRHKEAEKQKEEANVRDWLVGLVVWISDLRTSSSWMSSESEHLEAYGWWGRRRRMTTMRWKRSTFRSPSWTRRTTSKISRRRRMYSNCWRERSWSRPSIHSSRTTTSSFFWNTWKEYGLLIFHPASRETSGKSCTSMAHSTKLSLSSMPQNWYSQSNPSTRRTSSTET